MKHEVSFAVIDLPGEWEDRSAYQFLSPEPSGLDVPLASGRGAQVRGSRISVVFGKLPLEKKQVLEDLIKGQETAFRQSFAQFSQAVRKTWTHPMAGEISLFEFSFEAAPQFLVRQMNCYFPRKKSGDVVCLTMTSGAHDYERKESEMKQIFSSFVVKEG